jgi:type III restriction enzyme
VEETIPYYNDRANYRKNECFMKSPITVYNHCHVKGVLQNAFFMRQNLETQALAFKAITGIYIRPILLFVLKNQTADNESELKKIKQEFIDAGLPEEELKLKTNSCDELKDIDLQSETCSIRFIITVNNLTEAWRCPFAYIIASLEDRNKAVDLSPVLNCLLPIPNLIDHTHQPFNEGHIVVASSKFYTCVDHLKTHLNDLGVDDEHLLIQNKMVELLKDMSIWEVLAKENENVSGMKFGEGKKSFGW